MTDAFYDQVMALAGPAILYINTHSGPDAGRYDPAPARKIVASRLYFAALPKDQAKAIYATLEDTQGSLTLFGSALSGAEFRDRWTALHDGHPLGEAPDIG